jgi:hypothetical protein
MRKPNVLLLALTCLLLTGAWAAQATQPLAPSDPQTSLDEPVAPPDSGGSDEIAGVTGDPDDIIEGNRRSGSNSSCSGGTPPGGGTSATALVVVWEVILALLLLRLGPGS